MCVFVCVCVCVFACACVCVYCYASTFVVYLSVLMRTRVFVCVRLPARACVCALACVVLIVKTNLEEFVFALLISVASVEGVANGRRRIG